MTNEIVGAKSYLYLMTEATWGTDPDAGRVFVPVDDYAVAFTPENRQAKPYLGIYQRKHSSNYRGMPTGQLVCPLFGPMTTAAPTTTPGISDVSLAEYLLDWSMMDEAATIHEAKELPSKTAEWTEGPDVANKRHTGLRVNQATLSGSESTGNHVLTLDLMGKDENAASFATGTTIPTDMEEITDMEFGDCVFKLNDGAGGAVAAVSIESYQLQVQHSLQVKYNNATRPQLILKIDRNVTLQVTLDKNSDTYDAFRRDITNETDFVGTLIVQGLNNGTGAAAWTIGTISFPKLRYVNHADGRGRDQITTQPLQFLVTKPDTSSKDMSIAWTTDSSKAA